jgi:hypothetical protein
MTKLKLNQIRVSETSKTYKVEEGILYINDDPITLEGEEIVTWDAKDIEDFESIERNEDGDIVMTINIFTDQSTMNSFFSVVKKRQGEETILEDASFPYAVVDGEIIWEADLTKMEGMTW